jgi:hypothetical protein
MQRDLYTPPFRPKQSARQATRTLPREALIAAWLIGSALIAWTLVYLPTLAGASSANAVVALSRTPVLPAAYGSNPAVKGDRLTRTNLKTDGAVRQEMSQRTAPPRPMPQSIGVRLGKEPARVESPLERKIPIGCDGAFSRLMAKGNFSARCVT